MSRGCAIALVGLLPIERSQIEGALVQGSSGTIPGAFIEDDLDRADLIIVNAGDAQTVNALRNQRPAGRVVLLGHTDHGTGWLLVPRPLRLQALIEAARRQLADLAAIGITWDDEPQWQSRHRDRYDAVVDDLITRGLVYECYCSRRDILSAPRAPHAPEGAYPGTCRDLGEKVRATKRAGRPPALRLRSDTDEFTVTDVLHGSYTGVVDDFVLRRGDGVPAYNLAVVVDDAAQGVEQVVRGDDLALSSPRQRHLATLLGLPAVSYAHVPLVLGPSGQRLAKRDGATTLADLARLGHGPDDVRGLLAQSLGLCETGNVPTAADLTASFRASDLVLTAWTVPEMVLGGLPWR